ncbi:MAG: chromosomal replication initiator protein DnaA [Verrucomicrobiota bacterium]|nr:chromosomal replication initiator protein DnaA [Verrucomicrobiota bacterium]
MRKLKKGKIGRKMRAELWDIAVALYKASLKSQEEVEKWNRHAMTFASHKLEGSVLSIGVADQYIADYYAEIYSEPLRVALIQGGAPEDVKVVFNVSEAARIDAEEKRQQESKRQVFGESQALLKKFASTIPLNSNYTFENFVKGPSNSFAYAIASAIAKEPGGNTNNPFFIWGGTGLGKTHLMQAIGHYVLKHNPQKSVCYITSEAFLNEYINAISNKAMESFRKRYRHIDLLLLDDVQFVGGKEQFQEEFFNTYNDLMTYGKQVVMTCDVPPKRLNGFEERLVTRFQQGIVIEIESPSYETRIAILKAKARNCRQTIPDDIFTFIGENIKSSVRAMEGALNLVVRFMDANPNIEITKQMAQVLLKELTEEEVTIRRLSVEEIIKAVCSFYDTSYAEILSSNRTQPLATARQVAMFLARKLTGQSTPTVASEFKRNHTTVIYGAEAIQKRLSVEPKLRKSIEQITEQLGRKPSELFD